MKINLFRKKVTTKSGKTFYKFVSTLTSKQGENVYVDVMLDEEEAKKIEKTPCVLVFSKENANMSKKTTTDETGKEYTNNRLWVSEIDSVEPYVDKSLDDFE